MITAAVHHARTVLLFFVLLLLAGGYAYKAIPKESAPDIPLPIVYISVNYEGISPEDAITQLLKPLEQEMRNLEGLDDMEATAYEGGANLVLTFLAGMDTDQALIDVREKVDIAKAELPDEADEPRVSEVNISLFPIITVILSGDVPERTLKIIAETLQDDLEANKGILEAKITGIREEQLLLEINKAQLEAFDLSAEDVIQAVARNNLLIAAGSLETKGARYAVKVPGLFKTPQDVLDLPIKTTQNRMIRMQDIATVRLTFKDPLNLSFSNKKPAVTLQISKRIGANIIETAQAVKNITTQSAKHWPSNVAYTFTADESNNVKTQLTDLQNNVTIAIILVLIVILAALGPMNALLVATSVPGAFLTSILILFLLGFTTNTVVLFGLILSVGILVDGAIVVTEMADNLLAQGKRRAEAFIQAAKYMAWPIIASTATTLAAFLPLLFWPGVVGEFMKYMPLTITFTLLASLSMALIFIPTLGAVLPRPPAVTSKKEPFYMAPYMRLLTMALRFPKLTVSSVLGLFVIIIMAYSQFGKGIEFFPNIEPERAQLLIHAKGDYAIAKKVTLVNSVQRTISNINGIASTYTIAGENLGNEVAEDVIGIINLEYTPWAQGRPTSAHILSTVKTRTANLYGLRVELHEQEEGPSSGKPIQIVLSSHNFEDLKTAANRINSVLKTVDGLENIEDTLPLPGIEWVLTLNRTEAAKAGTDLTAIGPVIRLATNGAKVGTYRPAHAKNEIDIIARLKKEERTLSSLDGLTMVTQNGRVPLSQFITREAKPKVSTLHRLNQATTVKIQADVAKGFLANTIVTQLKEKAKNITLPTGVALEFKGESEDEQEASAFLIKAFLVALGLMIIILVTQFNSFAQPLVILSAVVLSTAGVLMGHLIMGKPFGIIMSGLGIIALAGIVVNNNIVLIDTFNKLKSTLPLREAIIKTATTRLRPVLLTAVTTMVGLMPMAFKVNIDIVNRSVSYNAPSMQWWDQIAASIVFGLGFATILTLVFTPCLLLLLSPKEKKKKL